MYTARIPSDVRAFLEEVAVDVDGGNVEANKHTHAHACICAHTHTHTHMHTHTHTCAHAHTHTHTHTLHRHVKFQRVHQGAGIPVNSTPVAVNQVPLYVFVCAECDPD